MFTFLNEAKDYILGLRVKGPKSQRYVPVVSSLIKTGFRGFIIDIESLKHMYRELVDRDELMHMITTYKLSQDHIEMLFCKSKL